MGLPGDAHRLVQRDLQIWKSTRRLPISRPSPIPSCSPRPRIEKIYNGYWFWGRPTTDELWQDLRGSAPRPPDWDLGAPGLRAAWEAGDGSQFYPYGARWWQRPD